MAQKPDGKGAKTERVTFTRPAAERIAKAVRKVEQGNRGAEPLRFDRIGGGAPYKLTLGTFTGEWQTNSSKIVTYTAGTTTATAAVFNWCNPALLDDQDAGNTNVSRHVIFGKVSGTNSAVEIQGAPYKLTLGTFTGEWQTNSSKIVTYTAGTTTATAAVFNWCNPALLDDRDAGNTNVSRYVIFGKVSGTNSAVEIQLKSASTDCTSTLVLGGVDLSELVGYDASKIQMLGHAVRGTAATACSPHLQWYSITTCSTATAA
jgi:hypothetical protein